MAHDHDHPHGPGCGHAHEAEDPGRDFFDIADQFIAVANRLADEVPASRISAAMMYATARFNAFLAQTQGLDAGAADEATIAYFREEYERMLRENMAQPLVAKQT